MTANIDEQNDRVEALLPRLREVLAGEPLPVALTTLMEAAAELIVSDVQTRPHQVRVEKICQAVQTVALGTAELCGAKLRNSSTGRGRFNA